MLGFPATFKTIYMKKNNFLLSILLLQCAGLWAQSAQDSITIANVEWEIHSIEKGIVHKRAHFSELYGGAQYVNIVEVDLKAKGYKTGVVTPDTCQITSQMAIENNAIVAINGSYYDDIKTGKSTCYYRVGKTVIDTTKTSEWFRVTGALTINRGKVTLMPWNKEIETAYNGRGTTLASGPLMIYNGKYHDLCTTDVSFGVRKHPRSAIALTNDRRMLLVVVDGRFPEQAEGMSIKELAHFLKMLNSDTALNLDGGRSTTLWSSKEPGNGVLNCPAANKKFDQFGERLNANSIVVYK